MQKTEMIVENKGNYLLITLPPYFSVQVTKEHIEQICDVSKEHACNRLLLDARATQKQIPILDLFEICLSIVETLGPLHPKIAGVVSPEAVYEDRFGENVLRNRGINFIRFTDNMDEALSWLIE